MINPSFTNTCHEHDPVQFTPCVERTTLSCAQRPRYERSQARSFATNWLQPSALVGPRRKNRCASSNALPERKPELADPDADVCLALLKALGVVDFRGRRLCLAPHYRHTTCAASPPIPITCDCSSSDQPAPIPPLERAPNPRAQPHARPAPAPRSHQLPPTPRRPVDPAMSPANRYRRLPTRRPRSNRSMRRHRQWRTSRSAQRHRCDTERRRCWWPVKAAAARTRLLDA